MVKRVKIQGVNRDVVSYWNLGIRKEDVVSFPVVKTVIIIVQKMR